MTNLLDGPPVPLYGGGARVRDRLRAELADKAQTVSGCAAPSRPSFAALQDAAR